MLNIQKYSRAREVMLKYFEVVPQNESQKIFINELHDLIEYADKSIIDYEIHLGIFKAAKPDEKLMYYKNLVSLYKRLLKVYNIDPSLITELDRY